MHYAKDPISGRYLACFGAKDLQAGLGPPSVRPISDCSTTQFEMRITENAGLGLFAKVKIKRGTKIIEETPIATVFSRPDANGKLEFFGKPVDSSHHSTLLGLARVQHRANDLFERVQQQSPAFTVHQGLLQYFYANLSAVEMANAFADGVFPTISRINHSCKPNCEKGYPQSGVGSVTASRDIEVGEELTLTYVDLFNGHPDDRFEVLYDDYGFICTCICCMPTNRSSTNVRRLTIKRLANDMSFLLCQRSGIEYGVFHSVLGPIKGKMMYGPLPASVSSEKDDDENVWRTMFEMVSLIAEGGIPSIHVEHTTTAVTYLAIMLFRKRPSPRKKSLCFHYAKWAGVPIPKDVSEYEGFSK